MNDETDVGAPFWGRRNYPHMRVRGRGSPHFGSRPPIQNSEEPENFRHLCSNPYFHFVQGSITDPGLLKDTFMNAEGIFNQAAIPSVPRSIRDQDVPRTR